VPIFCYYIKETYWRRFYRSGWKEWLYIHLRLIHPNHLIIHKGYPISRLRGYPRLQGMFLLLELLLLSLWFCGYIPSLHKLKWPIISPLRETFLLASPIISIRLKKLIYSLKLMVLCFKSITPSMLRIKSSIMSVTALPKGDLEDHLENLYYTKKLN
jgi:hypothetical protein